MERLIFVYNADSGLFNSLTDFAHKIISPSTYDCQLCALTYGDFTMKKEWMEFIKNLPVDTEFVYKDQFAKRFKSQSIQPPCIYFELDKSIQLLISAGEINSICNLADLKMLISDKLALKKAKE